MLVIHCRWYKHSKVRIAPTKIQMLTVRSPKSGIELIWCIFLFCFCFFVFFPNNIRIYKNVLLLFNKDMFYVNSENEIDHL